MAIVPEAGGNSSRAPIFPRWLPGSCVIARSFRGHREELSRCSRSCCGRFRHRRTSQMGSPATGGAVRESRRSPRCPQRSFTPCQRSSRRPPKKSLHCERPWTPSPDVCRCTVDRRGDRRHHPRSADDAVATAGRVHERPTIATAAARGIQTGQRSLQWLRRVFASVPKSLQQPREAFTSSQRRSWLFQELIDGHDRRATGTFEVLGVPLPDSLRRLLRTS